jgi:hypothetical protein
VGVDPFPGEQEVAPPVRAQQERPDDLHPVARHEPHGAVTVVDEIRRVSGQHDIGQNSQLRVNERRTVDGGDHGNLDVQQARDEADPFVDGMVPLRGIDHACHQRVDHPAGFGEVDEGVAGSGDDDHPVVAVAVDGRPQVAELAVGPAVPSECSTFGVEPDGENAVVGPGQGRAREAVLVVGEAHGFLSRISRAGRRR